MTAFVPPRRSMMAAASMPAQFRVLYGTKSSPLNGGRFRFLNVRQTLQERVALILEEQTLKPIELADVAGVTKGLVSQWLNGDRKKMGFDAATKLHRKYGYAINWLIKGDTPKMASEQEQAQARGVDVSDAALEIARQFDELSDYCKDHVRRQVELLLLADANGNGDTRRRAAQHDVEISGGTIRSGAQSKKQKRGR